MKLGAAMGEMSKPSKGGATKEAFCSSDADCSDNETCKSGNCVNVCNPSPCPSDEFCLNEGNHSYSCVECTSNEQCDDREICKNNSCVDACTGNPCASKNQACSSQSGHSYICYGCVNNNACSNGKICDTSSKSCVCPSGYEDDGNGGCKSTDPCEGVTCPYAHICNNGKCIADCPAEYSFNNTLKECVAGCNYQMQTLQCAIDQYQIFDYNSRTVRCQNGQTACFSQLCKAAYGTGFGNVWYFSDPGNTGYYFGGATYKSGSGGSKSVQCYASCTAGCRKGTIRSLNRYVREGEGEACGAVTGMGGNNAIVCYGSDSISYFCCSNDQ